MKIQFFVRGTPKPAGSKRGFAIKKGGVPTGKVAMVDMSGEKGKTWRQDVKAAAKETYSATPLDGPLKLSVIFYQDRPKGHFGTGRNSTVLKASAKPYPTSAPDATKLLRSIEDALTGILWLDDAQIVVQQVRKKYCDAETPYPGAWIRVETMD